MILYKDEKSDSKAFNLQLSPLAVMLNTYCLFSTHTAIDTTARETRDENRTKSPSCSRIPIRMLSEHPPLIASKAPYAHAWDFSVSLQISAFTGLMVSGVAEGRSIRIIRGFNRHGA